MTTAGDDDAIVYHLYVQGQRRLDSGDPRGAAEILELAVEHEPGKASLHETLARAYFATARVRRAREAFEEALACDPSSPYAHFGVGRCHERAGRLRDAAAHYKLACAMSERSAYHDALARVQARQAG